MSKINPMITVLLKLNSARNCRGSLNHSTGGTIMAIDVKLKLTDDATRTYNQFVGNIQKQAASDGERHRGRRNGHRSGIQHRRRESFMDPRLRQVSLRCRSH